MTSFKNVRVERGEVDGFLTMTWSGKVRRVFLPDGKTPARAADLTTKRFNVTMHPNGEDFVLDPRNRKARRRAWAKERGHGKEG